MVRVIAGVSADLCEAGGLVSPERSQLLDLALDVFRTARTAKLGVCSSGPEFVSFSLAAAIVRCQPGL
jgi:hypothetical protein